MKKIDIYDIKKVFNNEGFTILHYPNNYNINSKLTAINNDNELIIHTTYKIFKKSKNGYYFHQRNPYTLYNIRKWLIDNRPNIKLISEEYEGDFCDMLFYDKTTGREFTSSWSGIRSLKNKYDLSKRKITPFIEFRSILKEYGYDLIIKEVDYKGVSFDYKCITTEGYKVNVNYFRLIKNNKPSVFNVNNPYTIYNIKLWLSKNYPSIKIESDKFYGWNSKITFYNTDTNKSFECSFHDIWSERNNVMSCEYKSHKMWSYTVLSNYNYKCALTGESYNLNAHHIYNWKEHPSLRYDVSNGVCLSKPIHVLFHKIYGNKYNTKEQFDEFSNKFIGYPQMMVIK